MKGKVSRKTLREVIKRKMENPEFKLYYEHEKAKTALALLVSEARISAGLSQTELARRIGTQQSVIGRLESGTDVRTPSLFLLARIAEAVGAKLSIGFDKKKPSPRAAQKYIRR